MRTEIILGLLVWTFVFYGIYRGYQRERKIDQYAVAVWAIFVSLGLVYTFRIEAVQPFIDSYFDDEPVTFLASLLAVVTATAAYSIALKWLVTQSPEVRQVQRLHLWLIRAAPGILLALLVLMAAHLAGWFSAFQFRYQAKWIEEGYGLLQSALVFVPINRQMVRQERVFPMRVKHRTTLVLTSTFAVSAAFSVVCIPPILITGHENLGPYLIPRGPIAALCLVIILMPHRWLTLLLLPRRLRCYARLAALEGRLSECVTLRRERLAWWRFFSPAYVEMAIYVKLINILDHYRRADRSDPWANQLYAQIRAPLPHQADYDELVEVLCRISL